MTILQSSTRRTLILPGGRVISKRRGISSPLEIDDAVLWLDSSDTATTFQGGGGTTPAGLGDPVGYCGDKSGNGNNCTQFTAGNRPILTADGLDFDASDLLNLPDLGTNGHSIFLLCRSKQDTVGGFGNIYRAHYSALRDPIIYVNGANNLVYFSYNAGSGEEATTIDGFGHSSLRVVAAHRTGSAVNATIDGGPPTSATLSGSPDTTGGGAIGEFTGIIKEIVVYSRELTASEKGLLNSYMLARK